MRNWFPSTPDLIFAIVAPLTAIRGAIKLTQADGDFSGHVRMGNVILDTGHIPVQSLASYTAAIEWVFQRRGGVYTAHGIDAQLKSPLLQGLAVLLSLPHYRFAKEKVEKLLLCPPFLNRFNLSIQEGQRLSAWLEQFGFRYDLREGAGSLHAAVTRAVRQVADDLDFTEVPLLDTWITIALLLEEKLSCLSSLRTCVQWAEFVEDLLATFFAGEEIPPSLRSTVRVLCSEGGEALFPYASIERMLLTPAETGYNISVHGPCFVPLKRGALLPAHTLIVMGLSEGAFPHTEAPSPLAELSTRSRLEEDRGAFLEAVSGAQERLILTYVRVHPEDGKEVRPSSVVEELVRDRRGVTTFHHARAVSLEKPLSIKHQPLSAAPTLDLRLLKKVARHPIQSFFEESLKLTFPRSPSSEFLLSPLDTHKARALSLQHSPSEVIDMLEEEGKIPTGAFRKTALLMLEQELKTYKEALSALRVDPSTLFSLELTPHAKALEQISDSKWVAPPLKDVHGTLDNLTPQGLLYHGDNSLASLLKVWPLLCVASCYFGNLPLLLSKEGEVVQSPLKDPGAALTRYLDYCGKALTTPSPLMPAWGRRLLKEGVVPVEEDDPVLQWGRDRALLPPPNEWADSWRPYLMEVFCDLL